MTEDRPRIAELPAETRDVLHQMVNAWLATPAGRQAIDRVDSKERAFNAVLGLLDKGLAEIAEVAPGRFTIRLTPQGESMVPGEQGD